MSIGKGDVVVECSGMLGIGRADELRATLLAALEQGRGVEVDCAAATEIDLSFLQLLLAARRSAARRGVALRLRAPLGGVLAGALRAGGLLGADGTAAGAPWTGVA